ncbi:MAG: glutamyl-tRNA reductase [Proteobacteria bacterium]|nr:glutamyl-tRNA reductase [Pseudomonadota bacterium]MBU1708597.1 glutamyl-tRNA reductase [Pseudomonadota bacterium]
MLVDSIVTLGVNHKTAPVAVREKLAFSGECESPLVRLSGLDGCDECCFLSTCNRVEVVMISRTPQESIAAVRKILFEKTNLTKEETEKYSYAHQGKEAINHLFRVASSLDSMIVGEPQILGQLKQAYREASESKNTGIILNKLMHKAFSVAKRIRTETKIGSSAVSISYAAVELAKKIFGNLKGKRVLLVGAGEMAELAAEHLINQGVAGVVVANRTFERAVKLARKFNGTAVALEEIVGQLEDVDILISSTGATELILNKNDLKPIMRQRKNRPLFLIDIAVPRDLDPKLNELDNIYLYDIDDLTNVVEINKSERDKEAATAERIVKEETLKFRQWVESLEVAPTIVELRKKAEEIRTAELEKTFAQLKDLSTNDKKAIEIMANALANKLLHDPILFLKSEASPEDKQNKLDLIREMFGLDKNSSR